jgi:hypothetical protein
MSFLCVSGTNFGSCLLGIGCIGLVACSSGSGKGNTAANGTASNTDAGGGGGGGAPVTLGDCVSADTKPCGTFAYPLEDGGTQPIKLGPYGAQADVNVGQGFEGTLQASDQPPQPSGTCQLFASSFGEPADITNLLLKTTMNGITIDFSLYSAYRPANWPSNPVPVITWGNGTCAQPEGYGALLRYVASYGYFVIAANSRSVGSRNSDGSEPMLKALDFAAAANADPSSPYYKKLDMSKVGAMGHSQGGGATVTAAMDPRIDTVFIFNGGLSAVKPFVAVSGDQDIIGTNPSGMASAVNGASVPGAWFYYHHPVGVGGLRGHLVLMLTPERVEDQATSWFEMQFRSDATARAKFVGSSCGFCGHGMDSTNSYEYGEHGLD